MSKEQTQLARLKSELEEVTSGISNIQGRMDTVVKHMKELKVGANTLEDAKRIQTRLKRQKEMLAKDIATDLGELEKELAK